MAILNCEYTLLHLYCAYNNNYSQYSTTCSMQTKANYSLADSMPEET